MSETYPVYIQVPSPDGRSSRVQVGVAHRDADGFLLQLGNLVIGNSPVATTTSSATRSTYSGASAAPAGEVFPNYGRSKGGAIRGATMQDLEYYANGARRSLADSSKARFHDKERSLLAAIEAEIQRQQASGGLDGGNMGGYASMGSEPPPHGDEDVPF